MADEPRTPSAEENQKFLAEAKRAEAEARKADAEAQKLDAETRKAVAEADVASVSARRALREEEEALTANRYHRIYHFTSQVSEQSVNACMKELDIWRRKDEEHKPVEIIFTSPGGSVIDGMVLFDYIQMLRREGHQVTTGTLGMAASMAGILLQAGDIRWVGKEAWVLIHQASFGASGTMAQVEDTVLWVKRIQERILDIFATRAAAKAGKNVKVVRSFLKKNWQRRDWWISSDECIQHGLVDEVR